MRETEDRVLPFSEEAERGLLGSCLIDGYQVVPMCKRMRLAPEAFHVPAHRAVWDAVWSVWEQNKPTDLLTVGEALRAKEAPAGISFLEGLVDGTPTAAHAEYYADIVRQKWILRKIIETSMAVQHDALRQERGDEFLKQIPNLYMQVIEDVVQMRDNRTAMLGVLQDWRDVKEGKKKAGLPIPFERLALLMGGLCPGLYILAGRPAEGKTTLEDNLSLHVASQGHCVGRVTMDMTQDRLLARAMCRKGGVSMPKLKFGHAGEANLAKVTEAAEVIAEYPMFINEDDRELSGICTWARAMFMRHAMKMLTVDYVQQVEDARATAYQSEHQIITRVSRVFKRLANDLKIPVVLVSQLNREAEKVQRAPKLSDLRGSGSLEQDAMVVLMVYREPGVPITWDKENGKRPTWVEVAKNQDGECGMVEFWFRQNYFKFEEAPSGAFDGILEQAKGGEAPKVEKGAKNRRRDELGLEERGP